MKILHISHKPVFPKIDGGCVAMANFLELLLTNNHEVKHLTIETNKHPFNLTDYPKEIAQKTNPESIKINTDVKISEALPYLLKNGSYNVQRFFSIIMEEKIIETIQSGLYDCVILESLYTTPYLESIKSNFQGNVFLRSHNIEFNIWEDLKNSTKKPLKKSYLNKLFKDIKKYEIQVISRVDGIFTISHQDTLFYKNITSTPVETISFTLKTNETIENDYNGSNLFHLGGIDWEPNKEAAERLIRLFPKIKNKVSSLELNIIGKGTENLDITNTNSIFLNGFVDQIENLCISIGILVTPILSGSGIRIKILEMMALGIPVITTTKGAQGIDYTNHECLIIADSDEEIIQACIKLSSDKTLRLETGIKAKSYISKFHSISTSSEKLNAFLEAK